MQSDYENLKNKFKILLEKIFFEAYHSPYGRIGAFHIIYGTKSEAWSWQEYIDLKTEIYKYSEITSHFNKFINDANISDLNTVKAFLNWCTRDKDEFIEDDFLKKFQSFIEFFNSNTIEVVKECKIINFDSISDKINLDDEVYIKKIHIKPSDPGFRPQLYLHYEYKIFHKRRIKKTRESYPGENVSEEFTQFVSNNEMIENVIKAIHISNRSKCFRDSNTEISYSGFFKELISSVTTVRPFKPAIFTWEYFDEEKINNLKKPWKKLKQTNKRGHISSNRLLYASEKTNSDDKLLDYFIGLESLFLPDSGFELNFRLSLRIAKTLESDSSKQEEVFNFIKKMYGKRSNIVHGNNEEISNEDLQKLETILRKSIHIYLDRKEQFEKENLNKILF